MNTHTPTQKSIEKRRIMGRGRCDVALTTVAKHTQFLCVQIYRERKRQKKTNPKEDSLV